MRSLLLSLTFLVAAGLAALTPGDASAFGWRQAYYNGYYSGYYAPSYSYYGAYPYYTTSSYGGYTYSPYAAAYTTPYVSSYYTPTYGTYYSNYYSPSYSLPDHNVVLLQPRLLVLLLQPGLPLRLPMRPPH